MVSLQVQQHRPPAVDMAVGQRRGCAACGAWNASQETQSGPSSDWRAVCRNGERAGGRHPLPKNAGPRSGAHFAGNARTGHPAQDAPWPQEAVQIQYVARACVCVALHSCFDVFLTCARDCLSRTCACVLLALVLLLLHYQQQHQQQQRPQHHQQPLHMSWAHAFGL